MIDLDISNVHTAAIGFIYGTALAGIYFGALWLTVRHLIHHRCPEILVIGSLIVRLGLALIAFYLILDGGHWVRLLAALFGFIIVRTLFVRTSFRHTRAPAPS